MTDNYYFKVRQLNSNEISILNIEWKTTFIQIGIKCVGWDRQLY